MVTVDYERLRYIQLRGDGSKLPAYEWGGYNQDFNEAQHVHTHDEVEMVPADDWGVCDIEDPEHGSFALLVFDIDIHKAPDNFDGGRVGVPTDTLVVKSQNGGFHVYFALNGYGRGDLNESDFEMQAMVPFDIDIRGSVVSHHVKAPADIPGVGGNYEIVNDEAIKAYFEPEAAAERIQLDEKPLLSYNPDQRGESYDWDRPDDAPEEMPTCYFRGLELRKRAPDDHPNTHKVNVLTALCGLAAGYDVETVVDHFVGEWAPHDSGTDRSDRERTEYQVNHLAKQLDRDRYSPPAESTLRDYGILDHGEHCEECPIEYHGPRGGGADLDVATEMDDGRDAGLEAQAVAGGDVAGADAAETDGGVTAKDAGDSEQRDLHDRVIAIIKEFNDDRIQAKTARHRIALELVQEFDFVQPEREVRGWRETLYVFNHRQGIYEPRGEAFLEKKLEQIAGDFVTNQMRNEVVDKVRRMSIARGERFETDPHRLVVGNGILDLHTGELESYTPKELHRVKIDVDWNPDAGEPDAIDDWLHDIVRDRDVSTMYRLIAHSLYKEYIGEKAAMLVGSGQNGKSVYLDFVEQFLGRENATHRALQDFDDNDFAANQLEGKLANIHPDMGDQDVKDMSTFKKLTGRDTMLADVKWESPVEFENFATLLFAANSIPVFSEDTHAIWRRWVYVDFPYQFRADDPEAKDPEPKREMLDRLTSDEEMEALLYRCQQEIQQWHQGRDFFADAMRPEDVREKMKKAAEPVYNFATACLEEAGDEDSYVTKSQARACYRRYADEEDLPRVPENQFGERLLALRDFHIESGQRRDNGERQPVYNGVEFSSRGRQILDLDESDVNNSATQYDQAKPKVMDVARELVEHNDGDPVSEDMILGRAMGQMGRTSAEHAIGELRKEGELIEMDDGLLPT